MLLVYAVLRDRMAASRTSFLMAVPVVLSLESLVASSWAKGVLHQDFFVLAVMALTLLGLGAFFALVPKPEHTSSSYEGVFHAILGSAFAYALLWLALHAGLQSQDMASMIALVMYTMVGLGFYVYGKLNAQGTVRTYGSVLVALVIGRLLLVEVWHMALTGKIITFFLIGALLMSTVFIKRKE